MKRKTISLLLALTIATFGMTACGNNSEQEISSEQTESVPETEQVETEQVSENTHSKDTASETNDKIVESKSWPEYKETVEYYIEKGTFSENTAHMLNPDVYGTETAGKAAGDFDTGADTGDPSAPKYIKDLELTTTKGYKIWAYWYTDTNTVQFVYSGEVDPSGTWLINDASDYALNAAYDNKPVMDITHQQKIDALGAPSMTAEEVIAALQ